LKFLECPVAKGSLSAIYTAEERMQERSSSEELYHGTFINLRVQTTPQPDGGTNRFEIVEHPDAVAIVALRYGPANGSNVEPEVVLVNQERPAIQKKTWELPAGLVEANERDTPQVTAARELLEETGYVADHWQCLVREYPSPGFSTEAITIYLATQIHLAPGALSPDTPGDPTEISQVRWMPVSEALAHSNNGEIEDGKTLLGLSLVQNMLMSESTAIGEHAMPRDALNMPFPRSATFRKNHPNESETKPGDELNITLNIENMLLEEFNYASLTAYQALEDRARVSSLYYLLLGALASGLLAIYQLGGKTLTNSQPQVIALLVAAGILSVTFFEKIIRLRQAYRESLISMNVIKEFYIQQFQRVMPQIEQAFRWRLKTIPPGERIGSVTFAISALIAVVGSFCFAGAVLEGIKPQIITNPGAYGVQPYLIPLAIFVIILLLYIWYYRRSLSKRKEAEILEQQAEKIGIPLPTVNEQ
jgi:8-oxo-dGTP pyrophosphatase MutT (NUDIX family)